VNNQIYKLIWRIVAIVCILAWGIVLVHDVYLYENGYEPEKGEFSTPFVGILLNSITILSLCVLVAFPLKFNFYAVLCCLRGLDSIIDGGASAGFLMYLLGVIFAFRSGFFKKYREIKIAMLISFLILALVSQIRFSMEQAVISTLNILAVTLIFGLVYLLFLPDIRKFRKQSIINTNIVYLPAEQFSERDLRCLKKVQDGEKYESIAKDEDIGLSTLKNKMKTIYKSLDVFDKTSFLSAYAGYTILLKPFSNAAPADTFNQSDDNKTE
jgi:DNA-binding CsgD family transcriptional regulator